MPMYLQTKAFEEESKDSQPYKSVACVAEELKGLLTGSQRINAKKAGVGSIACITSVPEVRQFSCSMVFD